MKRSLLVVVGMLVCALLVQAADENLSITISDASGKATAIVQDFADAMGWTTTVSDGMGGQIPNPDTRKQYAKKKLEQHMREVVKAYRAQKKADAARAKEITDSDAEIIFK